jgi:large subunit ribosomal protein L25
MAKELRVLKVTARAETGSGPARRLRAAGQVPAVIYSRGKESQSLTIARGDMERVVNNAERLVKLDIDGHQNPAMVKQVQFEPVSRLISHVDFQEISASETITLAVSIRPRGTAAGVNEGGVLDVVLREVEIEAPATEIPEEIRIDVSGMNIGDVIRARDLDLAEGLTLITDANAPVLAVSRPRDEEDAETQVAPGEGGAGPEVLTGKKDEEGAGAGEGEGEAGAAAAEEKAPEPAGE